MPLAKAIHMLIANKIYSDCYVFGELAFNVSNRAYMKERNSYQLIVI